MILELKKFGRETFSSLKIRNFRLYFIGQGISMSGTWMQGVAQAWLVLQLTNSGTALGIVSALQSLPILLLGPLGGMVVDRFSKRRLLFITQSSSGVLALILGSLVYMGEVRLWMVYAMALMLGLINTIDNPTRQTFISEMVGEDELKNAITLNSIVVNLSRVIGPIIAGIIIATSGIAACFILNGFSFFAVVFVLLAMRGRELFKSSAAQKRGKFLDGFYYIISNPILKISMLLMAIIGTLTYEFQVSLPLLAQKTFHGDARSYAALMSALGVGAAVGGIISAGSKKINTRLLLGAAFFFGISVLAVAIAPSLKTSVALMVLVGIFSILFTTMGNTTVQLNSKPEMRGRVMAFWSMAFMGSTAVGGPIIGWLGQHIGPRWGLAVGGFSAIFAACLGFIILKKEKLDFKFSEAIFASVKLTNENKDKSS